MIEVREATTADDTIIPELYVASRRAAWQDLVEQRYLDELDVEEEGRYLREYLAPRDAGWRILVAVEEQRVVGFVTFVVDRVSGVGHVGALFVSPRRVGSGVGTSLLDAASAGLTDSGCDEAILWTLEEDRNVVLFYGRRGWQPDGGRQTIDLDRPRPVVRLRKRLRPAPAP